MSTSTRALFIAAAWSVACFACVMQAYDPSEAAEDRGEALAQLGTLVMIGAIWLLGTAVIAFLAIRLGRPN